MTGDGVNFYFLGYEIYSEHGKEFTSMPSVRNHVKLFARLQPLIEDYSSSTLSRQCDAHRELHQVTLSFPEFDDASEWQLTQRQHFREMIMADIA